MLARPLGSSVSTPISPAEVWAIVEPHIPTASIPIPFRRSQRLTPSTLHASAPITVACSGSRGRPQTAPPDGVVLPAGRAALRRPQGCPAAPTLPPWTGTRWKHSPPASWRHALGIHASSAKTQVHRCQIRGTRCLMDAGPQTPRLDVIDAWSPSGCSRQCDPVVPPVQQHHRCSVSRHKMGKPLRDPVPYASIVFLGKAWI